MIAPTPEHWQALERLEQAATPGPWRVADTEEEINSWWSRGALTGTVVVPDEMDDQTFAICATNDDDVPSEQNLADAAFIAAARTAVPELLRAVADLTAENERLRGDYDKVLTSWAESRKRHLAAESELAALKGRWEKLKVNIGAPKSCVLRGDEYEQALSDVLVEMSRLESEPHS